MRKITVSCLLAATASACKPAVPASERSAQRTDTTFAGVQERGSSMLGMGVDQTTSTHQFDLLPDGGRIELQRMVDDSIGVAQIRVHLRAIADAFKQGNFSTPAFVHMQQVPGTAVMAANKRLINYVLRDLPRGADLRVSTSDAQALAAIHEFIKFQRSDHHAGGANDADRPHTVHR